MTSKVKCPKKDYSIESYNKVMVTMFLQWQLAIVANVVMKLYYKEVLDPTFNYASRMQELMKTTMDQVRIKNYNAFLKHLHICNPILGEEFLEQVQMHYDMSFELEIQIKNLQILVTSYLSSKQKVKWFKQSNYLQQPGRLPSFQNRGSSMQYVENGSRKLFFWFQVGSTHYSNPNEICPFGNFWC